jgi:hypothetical protein
MTNKASNEVNDSERDGMTRMYFQGITRTTEMEGEAQVLTIAMATSGHKVVRNITARKEEEQELKQGHTTAPMATTIEQGVMKGIQTARMRTARSLENGSLWTVPRPRKLHNSNSGSLSTR